MNLKNYKFIKKYLKNKKLKYFKKYIIIINFILYILYNKKIVYSTQRVFLCPYINNIV
jgi:hypothetical protein